MNILVINGIGGGIGKSVIKGIKSGIHNTEITAIRRICYAHG